MARCNREYEYSEYSISLVGGSDRKLEHKFWDEYGAQLLQLPSLGEVSVFMHKLLDPMKWRTTEELARGKWTGLLFRAIYDMWVLARCEETGDTHLKGGAHSGLDGCIR